MISTLYDDRPAGRRDRSAGSASATTTSRTRVPGLSEQDRVYAPFGNDSLLLHDVTITNTSQAER